MQQFGFLARASAFSLAIAMAAPSWAQQAPADAQSGAQASETSAAVSDIVVTGTRITRNGNTAPTPVSVITADEIKAAAPVAIADYVNQLPALFGSQTPKTANTSIGGGLAGANILNLRNLGFTRTLTLFEGRRVPPSFTNGAADINSLPSALIQRVDIVTGGASAAWGSDAVSGVANFILDKNFTGVKGEVQGGMSTHGDAEAWSAELSAGTSFADNRGHFIVSGNYSKTMDAYAGDRSWFKHYKILTNPAFAPGNGQPARLILPNSSIFVNGPGFVATGPLAGLQWDANGQPLAAPINLGTVQSSNLASGAATEDVSEGFGLQSPVEQGTGFARLSYDVTDKINVFGEATYGKSRSLVLAGTFFRPGNVTIGIDNPYLTPAVVARMTAAGVTTFPLSASYSRAGRPQGVNDRELQRYTAGFNAKFSDGWSLDGYVQRGISSITNAAGNNMQPGRFTLAVDTVRNSAGQIVCRSTLTTPGNGCVPLNPFGTAPLTTAQRDYLVGRAVQHTKITENVAALTLHGEIPAFDAGPIGLAIGGEYRREAANADADPVSIASGYYVGNYKPFAGRYSVKEAFAEVLLPVLKDSSIGSLDLNGAARITDYTTSGTVETWKLGFTYKPVDNLTIRATRSRDIRAPNLNELFLGGQLNLVNVPDPFRNNTNTFISLVTSGNRTLTPEFSQALTVGLVYQPTWLPGLSGSVDFYRIKISNAIFTPAAAQILSQCQAGDATSCGLVTRDAAGVLTQIRSIPINSRSEIAQGVDVELGYRTSIGNLFSDESATLSLRAFGNYVDKLAIQGVTGKINRVGEVGTNLGTAQGVPRLRGLVSIGYDAKPISMQLKGRFIGGSKIEADWGPLDVNINKVPAILYLDAFLGYSFETRGGKFQIYGAMDNILDTSPPIAVSQDNINIVGTGTNTFVYDTIGRTWRVGARFQF